MTRKIRIGLFFSQSTSFPQADSQMTDGARAGLFGCESVEFEVLGYAVDANSRRLAAIMTRAFTVDRLDAAIITLGYAVLTKLAKELAMYRKPIFIVSSGADCVREEERFPFIFRNSMLYWESAWESGRFAGAGGGRTLLVSTMLDCCYDSHSAFLEGVKAAGGEAFSVIADAPDYTFHGPELLDAIRRAQPDRLAIYACGSSASEIMGTISGDEAAASLPVLYGPMLHEAPLVTCLGRELLRGPSFFSFSDALFDRDSDACRVFKARWKAVASPEPDFFSLFAYEAALFLRKAFETTAVDARGADCIKTLETLSIKSPRGIIAMNKNTHSTCGSVFIRNVSENEGMIKHATADAIKAEPITENHLAAIFGGHFNRWTTDYIQA